MEVDSESLPESSATRVGCVSRSSERRRANPTRHSEFGGLLLELKKTPGVIRLRHFHPYYSTRLCNQRKNDSGHDSPSEEASLVGVGWGAGNSVAPS